MLLLFDLDGTLISSYMETPGRAYERWEVLPGRRERLAQLAADGHQLGIVTNQGRVAFGGATEEQAQDKLAAVLHALNLPASTPIAVCFAHPHARLRKYRDPAAAARRKPSGAMIRELMAEYPAAAAAGVVYVGDRPEDEGAAQDAGVSFVPAEVFFSSDYRLPSASIDG
jgi:D-glycero-D-manno-heptose 1,7-bisphosphate phosphatase